MKLMIMTIGFALGCATNLPSLSIATVPAGNYFLLKRLPDHDHNGYEYRLVRVEADSLLHPQFIYVSAP